MTRPAHAEVQAGHDFNNRISLVHIFFQLAARRCDLSACASTVTLGTCVTRDSLAWMFICLMCTEGDHGLVQEDQGAETRVRIRMDKLQHDHWSELKSRRGVVTDDDVGQCTNRPFCFQLFHKTPRRIFSPEIRNQLLQISNQKLAFRNQKPAFRNWKPSIHPSKLKRV